MHIQSCLSRLPNRRPRPSHRAMRPRRSRGQVLVIFAVALVAMLLFVGLAIDAGVLYITYGQLKRAVDAAAVAAANEFKRGSTLASMREAANEELKFHNIDTGADLELYICDADGDGIRDASLQTTVEEFYYRCPDTTAGFSPRKLVWVEAKLKAPLYFLSLIGFRSVNLNTNAISEAAPVDVVIVLDTSESMASDTINYLKSAYPDIVDDYNPDAAAPLGCNTTNSCQPLLDAKTAAKALIDTLYEGYDQVSIVTFDSVALAHPIVNKLGNPVNLSDDMEEAKAVVDSIPLHDDPAFARMWPYWKSSLVGNKQIFNPVNPEDRDGDGADTDPNLPPCYINPYHPLCCTLDEDRWDETKDPFGWGGIPCDDSYKNDAYDWNGDGEYTDQDHTIAEAWQANHDPDGTGPLEASFSPLSTSTGAGIRVAANVLKSSGRPGAVWVVVFLSDGFANLSDTPLTNGDIPAAYPNGFCSGELGSGFWTKACLDLDLSPRYCIDDTADTCPPDTTWQGIIPNSNYSVIDYARDMTDEAALTKSLNLSEPPGNDIAIYTIGLGAAGDVIPGKGAIGEVLLRYMAAVGDDGDRTTDPCKTVANKQSCGQYYYAPSGEDLLPIFEDIATRIYTRITN